MIMSMWTVASSDQNRSDALFDISKLIIYLMYPCFPVQFPIKINNPLFHTWACFTCPFYTFTNIFNTLFLSLYFIFFT